MAAIRKVAERRFPEVARVTQTLRAGAAARKAEGGKTAGRGRPKKSLPSREGKLSRHARTTAAAVAKELAVSRATVERVDALAKADSNRTTRVTFTRV